MAERVNWRRDAPLNDKERDLQCLTVSLTSTALVTILVLIILADPELWTPTQVT